MTGMVHVHTDGPRGWVGRVSSQTGNTVTIVAPNGVRRLVDLTRVTVHPAQVTP